MENKGPLRVLLTFSIISLLIGNYLFSKIEILKVENPNITKDSREIKTEEKEELVEVKIEETVIEEKEAQLEVQKDPIVYDGLTMEELSAKLDRSLHSNLSGYGSTFARLSMEYNMDPYLVVAIVLQETGCKWGCSYLVRNCNNIGGMKGSPSCAGSYRSFETLEIGIQSYVENLYYNYYNVGLTTPEAMNTKYAESTDWSSYVNAYIEEIKAS